jgi:Na+-transporting NADH:ubiquinone oxidoreductase subunit C
VKLDTNSPAYIIVYAAATAAVFTGGIMALHKGTEGIVERNALVFQRKSVVRLFDLGDVSELSDAEILEAYDRHVEAGPTVVDPESGERFDLLLAYDRAGGGKRLIGYAFPIWGVGFWAEIRGMMAVTPDLETTIGAVFIKHSETPGLGGRITEDEFQKQFRGLDITPPAQGTRHIRITHEEPARAEERRRHVDAITGATGTSTAVEKFINERLAQFLRAMAAYRSARAGG